MIPGFEWPIIYDIRARPNVIQSTSGSRDLQMVTVLNLPPMTALHSIARVPGICSAQLDRD